MNFIRAAFAAVLSLALISCGGGGDGAKRTCSEFAYQEEAQAALNGGATELDRDNDGVACENLPHRPITPSPGPGPTQASAAGLWLGTTNTNRSITGLVLPTGAYWVLYSSVGNPALVAGVIQGNGSVTGSTFVSSNARDFNLEGLGVSSATVSASIVTKQTFNGSLNYAGSSVAFAAAYSSDYERTPSLSSLQGTYTGQVALSAGVQSAVVTVTSGGAISSTSSGCMMSGVAVPRTDANAYDISLTFGPAPCFFAGQTLSGIAYLNDTTRTLYAAAPDASRTNGVLFVGAKP